MREEVGHGRGHIGTAPQEPFQREGLGERNQVVLAAVDEADRGQRATVQGAGEFQLRVRRAGGLGEEECHLPGPARLGILGRVRREQAEQLPVLHGHRLDQLGLVRIAARLP